MSKLTIFFLIIGAILAIYVIDAATFTVSDEYRVVLYRLGYDSRLVEKNGLYWNIPIMEYERHVPKGVLCSSINIHPEVSSPSNSAALNLITLWKITDPKAYAKYQGWSSDDAYSIVSRLLGYLIANEVRASESQSFELMKTRIETILQTHNNIKFRGIEIVELVNSTPAEFRCSKERIKALPASELQHPTQSG